MTTTGINESVVKSLVASLTGFPVAQVITDPAQPLSFVDPTLKGQIFLTFKSSQALGVDDFSSEYDANLGYRVVTQKGNRLFTLSIRMESYISASNAYVTLERLRTKLFRPSSLAFLRAANMTACTAEAVTDLPREYDSRVISVANLDIHMSLFLVEVDDTDDGNWIETFDLSSDIHDTTMRMRAVAGSFALTGNGATLT